MSCEAYKLDSLSRTDLPAAKGLGPSTAGGRIGLRRLVTQAFRERLLAVNAAADTSGPEGVEL